jgi:hypothetical protein
VYRLWVPPVVIDGSSKAKDDCLYALAERQQARSTIIKHNFLFCK